MKRSLSLLLVVLAPSLARAAVVVPVGAEGCGALDLAEVERVLALELAHLLSDKTAVTLPKVKITCAGAEMRIRVDDPVTGKTLERTLPMPTESKGRERTMALAISQLFLTSWLELLSPAPKEVPAPVTQAPPELTSAAHDAARTVVTARRTEVDLGAAIGLRRRDFGAAFSTFAPSVRATFALPSALRFVFDAGLESGTAVRSTGSVAAVSTALLLGVGARHVVGVLALDATVFVGGRWTRLDGRIDDPAFEARGASGGSLEALVAVGPTLRLGPVRIGAEVLAGRTFSTLRANVVADREVSFGGFFAGAGLFLGAGIGGGP
ncbi:MAG: hypothetical protein JNL79_11505 [Myxococcales bacterium]|nr:hypothetical protein [Myxococcales bacterium]